MDFAEITIRDKDEFQRILRRHNPQISELTFTNLFAWRNFYKFRYTIIEGLLCIISVHGREEPFAMMPIGDVNEESFAIAFSGIRDYFLQKGWRPLFRKITKNELKYFKSRISSEEAYVYDRNNSDYLYNADDLIKLQGKKYDSKRNHINKFKRQHIFEYVSLDSSLLDECIGIMERWCKDRKCKCKDGDYCERNANMELLSNFETLDYKGALIKMDGAFEAFTIGEMLNEDTAVIHIEKANNSVDGLYTIMNQQFAQREWSGATYINREQDLGLEGIRKAKLSYQPLRLIDKYSVYPA